MITVYGIPNCDSVKKARTWLEQKQLEYRFHDFRKDGIAPGVIQDWCKHAGIDRVLNRRGTTWRKLDPAMVSSLDDEGLIKLMSEQPSLIKRPVVEQGNMLLVGFSPEQFETLI